MRLRIAESVIELTQGDLAQSSADAIVNAANAALAGGGGVDGAIHRAGGPAIMAETDAKYPQGCLTGSAVISGAGELDAKFVIHAVGPVWRGGTQGEPELLRSAYQSSLQLAVEHACTSIAMPALSTGAYGYPMDLAAKESLRAIADFLRDLDTPLHVRIVLYDAGGYGAWCRALDELSKVVADWFPV